MKFTVINNIWFQQPKNDDYKLKFFFVNLKNKLKIKTLEIKIHFPMKK